MVPRNSMRTKSLFFERGQVFVENYAKMAKLPRLVLEVYAELSLESRQYVK